MNCDWEKYVGAKLHGIRMTDAKLNYDRSITVVANFCRAVGRKQLEYVETWNKMCGVRTILGLMIHCSNGQFQWRVKSRSSDR
ncbi:MAG: hypothetical protein EOS76_17910 [Mesorhizobium sp.]|uniref:aspartate 1-decarboxylase n=1 Tax=Mesorhizobium sp. TaxID=1871066 RepID=UPI000FE8D324|nr:MAG: hypothetical protein EOS76_17910 [Mesorhizobium sp.]